MTPITPHFSKEEFECTCGCNTNQIDLNFVNKLEQARVYANSPFHIDSGYRCALHNLKVGGVSNSAHLYGHAADIRCSSNTERFMILEAVIKAGFLRIGIGKTFIHVDDSFTLPSPRIWLYGD
jgi:zinc D-Ala-D-Ala carboxypeptidase